MSSLVVPSSQPARLVAAIGDHGWLAVRARAPRPGGGAGAYRAPTRSLLTGPVSPSPVCHPERPARGPPVFPLRGPFHRPHCAAGSSKLLATGSPLLPTVTASAPWSAPLCCPDAPIPAWHWVVPATPPTTLARAAAAWLGSRCVCLAARFEGVVCAPTGRPHSHHGARGQCSGWRWSCPYRRRPRRRLHSRRAGLRLPPS